MKEVLLSHDSKVCVYSVPDEVADDLDNFCWQFAAEWIWKDPNGAKLLKNIRGQRVAVYGAPDFIDYLNEHLFPEQPSVLVKQLDCYDYELSAEYSGYPRYNF
jgi:hypothetical protein